MLRTNEEEEGGTYLGANHRRIVIDGNSRWPPDIKLVTGVNPVRNFNDDGKFRKRTKFLKLHGPPPLAVFVSLFVCFVCLFVYCLRLNFVYFSIGLLLLCFCFGIAF